MLSVDGRNWALTSALELEGKIIIDSNIAAAQTSPEQLAEIPIEKLLKSLSTKIDPDKIHGKTLYLEISYTDTGEEYSLIIDNDILTVTEGIDDPYNVLSLDTETHKKILTQNISIFDAIDSGLVDFDGRISDLELFLNAFDPLTINTVQIG